jgi:hypothetical protein
MMQDVHVKLTPGIAMAKAAFNTKKILHQQIGIKFKEEATEVLRFMVLK